jgi:ethanolamine ammonia-lyase large subunit
MYAETVGSVRYAFPDLRTPLAKASPPRSGDALAGLAAGSAEERVAAQMSLADLPLSVLLGEAVVPYERDEVTRLIVDTHDAAAFAPVAHLTVGGFREWLLSHEATSAALTARAGRSHPRWPRQSPRSCGCRISWSWPGSAGS